MLPARKSIPKSRIKEQAHVYQYGNQPIPYSIWLSSQDTPITTVVFLGTVQVGKLPAWIARHCPEGTAVVQGAPHWLAKADGSDLDEFMRHFTEHAYLQVLAMQHSKKLRAIVDSQATPNALHLLSTRAYLSTVGSVVLIQPLGLNPQAFVGTKEQRMALFKERVAKNLRHQLPFLVSDRKLIYNHRQILRTVGYGNAKSNAQYDIGLLSDSITPLKKLHQSHVRLAIVCGGDDELFPASEIYASLHKNALDIPIIVVPRTPHSPLATRQGMRLFTRSLDV